jgi:signal transduction histidine kinase
MLISLNYYRKTENWKGITMILDNLGRTYNLLKQYDKSIECFKQCISISEKRNFTGGLQFIYEVLAQTYDNAHDYKNARDYYIKYMIIRDSIYNATKSQQIFELETKYQSEKKEKEILGLTLEKKNRGFFIYILSSIIILLSLAGLFIILRNRSKRLIAEQDIEIKVQKIKELEKEHLLLATQSVLEGEEAERQRLARDLHDGLGGLLSGVKLSLNNMKGNTILPNESVTDFDHALGLLDMSIKELRRVAHNMMPEALVKFGLKDALNDFCENMNASNSMNIRFQFIGQFGRVEQKLEIGIYRILQELINNSIKHSGAGELIVQMVQEANRLCLIVQDDGKGFDVVSVIKGKGIGLNSVKSRIESLDGRIDIYSEPGKGAEFIIEFTI